MEILLALLAAALALVLAWALRRRRRHRALALSQPYSIANQKLYRVKVPFEPPLYPAVGLDPHSAAPAVGANTIEVPLSGEDVYIREAYAAAAYWKRAQVAVDQTQRALMQPIREKLHKAQRLVAESGVGGSACDLLQIMWHWPARAKHADWQMPVAIAALEGSEAGAGKAKWIAWTRNGLRFRLQLDAGSNDNAAAARIGELTLAVDGEEVLRLDVAHGVGDDHDRWRVSGVSAFRAGPWMMQLNELAGELRIANSQTVREHVLQFYGEKARNIVL